GIDAGIPPGVFNVVTGYGEEAGAELVNHPGVRKVGFTGSVDTGKKIMMGASNNIIPVTLELGGKSPNIVFEEANLKEASLGALKAFISNTGQVCSAGTRLLVQNSIKEEFIEKLIKEAKKVKIDKGTKD